MLLANCSGVTPSRKLSIHLVSPRRWVKAVRAGGKLLNPVSSLNIYPVVPVVFLDFLKVPLTTFFPSLIRKI